MRDLLSAIPPVPREPSDRARELVFRYQGSQKALLIIGIAFTIIGSVVSLPFCWGIPGDLIVATQGTRRGATVISTHVNQSVTVNGRHPTVIRFAYDADSGRRVE